MTVKVKTHKRKGVILKKELLPIPEKRYFSISETARLCGVKAYILRFWEQEFNQLKPDKRRGNRRYYQYQDLILIRQIRKLLYEDGFTIEGARAQLSGDVKEATKESRVNDVAARTIAELEALLLDLKAMALI
ncbi:MAG TPA: MerR family transcriptional regulator [Gammaproteobacteria bacterium]|nr:MerR family transcriptional regulator [Gammaproteobacteria bacterium]